MKFVLLLCSFEIFEGALNVVTWRILKCARGKSYRVDSEVDRVQEPAGTRALVTTLGANSSFPFVINFGTDYPDRCEMTSRKCMGANIKWKYEIYLRKITLSNFSFIESKLSDVALLKIPRGIKTYDVGLLKQLRQLFFSDSAD